MSSNKELTVQRGYKKLIDVFSDVGGISEVISFVIAILYSWYNSIKMEKLLLNKGVLQIDKVGTSAKDEHSRRPFTFFELLGFTYLSCCMKKKPRYKLYEACQEKAEERTDFLTFIKTQGNNEAMLEALFKPYQRKLLTFVKVDREDTTEDDEMSIEEALGHLKSTEDKDEFSAAIDRWLKANIDVKEANRQSMKEIGGGEDINDNGGFMQLNNKGDDTISRKNSEEKAIKKINLD